MRERMLVYLFICNKVVLESLFDTFNKKFKQNGLLIEFLPFLGKKTQLISICLVNTINKNRNIPLKWQSPGAIYNWKVIYVQVLPEGH